MKLFAWLRFADAAPDEEESAWWRLRLPDGITFQAFATESQVRSALSWGDPLRVVNPEGVTRLLNARQVIYAERLAKGEDSTA